MRPPVGPERTALLKSAVDAAPGDRHVRLFYIMSPSGAQNRARAYEALTQRIPDFAPPWRLLAYLRDVGRHAGTSER